MLTGLNTFFVVFVGRTLICFTFASLQMAVAALRINPYMTNSYQEARIGKGQEFLLLYLPFK